MIKNPMSLLIFFIIILYIFWYFSGGPKQWEQNTGKNQEGKIQLPLFIESPFESE